MQGRGYIFINFKQAGSAGHIGWGFSLDAERYHYGSADHLWSRRKSFTDPVAWFNYARVEPGGNIDWWEQTGSFDEMIHAMRHGPHIRYHAYKCVTIDDATPHHAVRTVSETAKGGWMVLNNNCIHQAYRILRSYGAKDEIPNPDSGLLIRISKVWFRSIEAEEIIL
jgi:hypothetical protein